MGSYSPVRKKKVIAQKEMALSRAVSWSQIQDVTDSFLKKVQVAGESEQVRMSTNPRFGRVLLGMPI